MRSRSLRLLAFLLVLGVAALTARVGAPPRERGGLRAMSRL